MQNTFLQSVSPIFETLNHKNNKKRTKQLLLGFREGGTIYSSTRDSIKAANNLVTYLQHNLFSDNDYCLKGTQKRAEPLLTPPFKNHSVGK
jgi:hypothetical protein